MTLQERIEFLNVSGFETQLVTDVEFNGDFDKLHVWKKGYIDKPKNYDGVTFFRSAGDFDKPISEWFEEIIDHIKEETEDRCARW